MDSEEFDTQSVSLMEHEIHDEAHEEKLLSDQSARKSKSFWSGIFRRKNGRNTKAEEEEMENCSLLTSGTIEFMSGRRGDDEELDDYRDDGENTPARQSLLEESDDEDSSEEDDLQNDGLLPLVSDEESLEENENEDIFPDLINMHASEPILGYSQVASEVGLVEDDSNDMDESQSCSNDTEDENEDDDFEASDRFGPLNLAPPRMLSRSQSVNSYYSTYTDYSSSPIVDPENRKRIKGRIEGFGSIVADPLASPKARSFREKIRNLASRYRMRKMDIGTEDTINRKSWVERFDNAVDSVLPDPELEGYIDAAQLTELNRSQICDDPQKMKSKKQKQKQRATTSDSDEIGSTNFRRKNLGDIDDTSYIMFLEIELQNKELEVDAWKRRVQELKKQVRRLEGATSDSDDDCSSTDSSVDNQEEQQESEIEWETGTTKDGILIEVEGPTQGTAMHHMSPCVQVASQEVDSSQVATFMLLQTPDSPDLEKEEPKKKVDLSKDDYVDRNNGNPGEPKEDLFPVLSSNHNSGTVWMDVSQPESTAIASSNSETASECHSFCEEVMNEVDQRVEDSVMSNQQRANSLEEGCGVELMAEKSITKGDTSTDNSGNTVSAEISVNDEEGSIGQEEDAVKDLHSDSDSEEGQRSIVASNFDRSVGTEEISNDMLVKNNLGEAVLISP